MATKAKVNPRTSTPTHTMSLSDGSQTWGLLLDDNVRGIQEQPQTPSSLLINSQGGQFGDYDPSMSHIQQNTWAGGRGSEKFSDDNGRYFDAKNLWTLNDGAALPSLQWKYVLGTRSADGLQLQNNYKWFSLSDKKYSRRFTPAANYTTTKISLWVKRVGNPGTLTAQLCSLSGDEPGTVLRNATNTGATLNRNEVYFLTMSWGSSYALTGSTGYDIVISGAATDSPANHWEIMTVLNPTGATAYTQTGAGAWTATNYKVYYRVMAADPALYYRFFSYGGSIYAVTVPESGASRLYKIENQANADATSTGTDKKLTEVATTGLTVVTDVLVSNGIVYFAQGEATNIRRWNGTTFADDGTNKATFLYNYIEPFTGPQIWRANAATSLVSKAAPAAWGTDLVFGTGIKVGENTSPITGFCGYNDSLWVFKKNSIWTVRGGKIAKLDVGIDKALDNSNGAVSTAHGLFLYFSYVTSLEQLYGSTLSDVGPGHGAGLPVERVGEVSALESVMSHLFVAIDGGTDKYSSVFAFDGINYHEIWRAPEIGKRIRGMIWQPGNNGTYPYLFIGCGGDIIFIKFPLFGFNVQRDTNMYFLPEGQLVTSTFDMNATRLPKIFKELTAITKNLAVSTNKSGRFRSSYITDSSRISVDYQCDDDIGTDSWIYAGEMFTSPTSTLTFNEDNRYQIRFRLRLQAADAANPPVLQATVLEGVARTPIKYQWVLRVKVSSIQTTLNGAPDHNPDKLLKWLREKATRAEKIMMHSTLSSMDGRWVMSEPPSVMREFSDPRQKSWGGTITLVLRET